MIGITVKKCHLHTRSLKYSSIYAVFKTKEYIKIKIKKNNTNQTKLKTDMIVHIRATYKS